MTAHLNNPLNSSFSRSLSSVLVLCGATVFAPGGVAVAAEIILAERLTKPDETFGQVTSVSQLRDVKPTDWAFQALQSLVERYSCLVGYPERTFRGNQALTRYEFAAGLNACIAQISELMAAGTANLFEREDLPALQRLQKEFATELAVLRRRLAQWEVRRATLERQQFSPTTQLSGQVIFALSASFEDSDQPLLEADLTTTVPNSNQTTFSDVVLLTFNSSFTGKDQLLIQLQAFNVVPFPTHPFGPSYLPTDGTPDNSFLMDSLSYSFPVTNGLTANVFATGAAPEEIVTTNISPLNNSAYGAVSGFSNPPQYQFDEPTTGAGASLNFNLGNSFIWDVGYLSAVAPNQPLTKAGLFNGPYTLNTQINYLSSWLDISFYYAHSYTNPTFGPPFLVSIAGYNPVLPGQSVVQVSHLYATKFNFKFGKNAQFNLGGGVVYASLQGLGARPDYDAWSYQGTFAWNMPSGSQFGLLAGVPPYTRDLRGQSSDTGLIAELYYTYKVNNNLSITPSLILQVNPYNVKSNPNAWMSTIRMTFTF